MLIEIGLKRNEEVILPLQIWAVGDLYSLRTVKDTVLEDASFRANGATENNTTVVMDGPAVEVSSLDLNQVHAVPNGKYWLCIYTDEDEDIEANNDDNDEDEDEDEDGYDYHYNDDEDEDEDDEGEREDDEPTYENPFPEEADDETSEDAQQKANVEEIKTKVRALALEMLSLLNKL